MINQPQELRFKGLGVSEGVVIRHVLRMHDGTQHVYRWKIDDADLDAERQRFRGAVALAEQAGVEDKEQAEERLGKDHAYILMPTCSCSKMRSC